MICIDATQSETSIGDYIDNFYNVERRDSHLGYVNPVGFEHAAAFHVRRLGCQGARNSC